MPKYITTLQNVRSACKQQGLKLIEYPNGHIQIRGLFTVNWYPTSSKQTLYVNGAVSGIHHCSMKKAIRIARGVFGAAVSDDKELRKQRTWVRSERNRLLIKDPRCHWCRDNVTETTATLEHKIPISKGGSNRRDNLTLACEPCNSAKGYRLGAPPNTTED